MKLNGNNLKEWKIELNKEAKERMNHDCFSESLSDEEWIKNYMDEDTIDVVIEEMREGI